MVLNKKGKKIPPVYRLPAVTFVVIVVVEVVDFFSRGHATLHLAVSVGPSVRPSVGPSVTFLNSERFSHYCSCPTVRDWIAVYPALFQFDPRPHGPNHPILYTTAVARITIDL